MGSNPIPSAIGADLMKRFYLWTVGCQMNQADSERMGVALERLGLTAAQAPGGADVVVLNSCVVRQGAEDRVVGMLTSLRPWRERETNRTLALMGCMVGPKQEQLRQRFPYVDVFMRPQEFTPLIEHISERFGIATEGCIGPLIPTHPNVTAYVPIIHGCDKFCTFCIIPYRRGREVSRPIPELVEECRVLAGRGVAEVTLLGQNVDSYGKDLPGSPDLADLLEAVHEEVPQLQRIRFLTSHPNDMTDRIIHAVGGLPRVMEHINLPVQAGDDNVLSRMRRGYTVARYEELVARIREEIPGVTVSTDLIVGFPGETREQFDRSLQLLHRLRFDKVHVAAYSDRPHTLASRRLPDDVSTEEKHRRRRAVEELQERVLGEINAAYLGSIQEVLVDGYARGKWQGRTRGDKRVHIESDQELSGRAVSARIMRTSPWSLQGRLARVEAPVSGRESW